MNPGDKFKQKGERHEHEDRETENHGHKEKGDRLQGTYPRRHKYLSDQAENPKREKFHNDVCHLDHCLENPLEKALQDSGRVAFDFRDGVAEKETEEDES